MGTYRCGTDPRCDCLSGVTVKVGWIYIGVGVGSAVLFQHLDSLIFGGFVVAVGVWMLLVKEKEA